MGIEAILALFGGVALLIGIFGGGIEAEKIKIPQIGCLLRVILSLTGTGLLALAVTLAVLSRPELIHPALPAPQNDAPVPSDTPEPATSVTPELQSGGSDATGTYTMEKIRDNSGSILLMAPTTWRDRNGGAWVLGGETLGIGLWAGPDLNACDKGTSPCVFIGASKVLAQRESYIEFLDSVRQTVNCNFVNREDAYLFADLDEAERDLYNCSSPKYNLVVFAGTSKDRSYLAIGWLQIVSDADWDLYVSVLQTEIYGY
jgi:hypothetical protein